MSDERDETDDSDDPAAVGPGTVSEESERTETTSAGTTSAELDSGVTEPTETESIASAPAETESIASAPAETESIASAPAETEPVDSEPLRLEDLSVPQRVFVAAVQNPSRGVFILFLVAFAFSFYIALWMAFPRVAGIGTLVVGVAGVLIGMLLYLFR